MMITVPEKSPADPRPATTRPAMKAFELGAAPQMAEPISKTVTHELLYVSTPYEIKYWSRRNKQHLQIYDFDRIELVQLPKEQHEGAPRKQEGARIPADVVDRMKFICDLGHCCSDDSSVLDRC